MSILRKIVPFYSAIEQVIKAGSDILTEDQKRRTLRTEAELKIQIQTEVKKQLSAIEEKEKEAQHQRDIDIKFKEKEADDLIDLRESRLKFINKLCHLILINRKKSENGKEISSKTLKMRVNKFYRIEFHECWQQQNLSKNKK